MEFEIGLLLFNRPTYAKKAIASLIKQAPRIDLTRVHIFIDGYFNSKDEYLKLPNRTEETIDLVQRYLPECNLIASSANLGIALAYERLGSEIFLNNDNDLAVFLEEDLVIKPTYFNELTKIGNTLNLYDEISMFSATGDSAKNFTKHSGNFKPMNHLWNYALRRTHFFERGILLSEYITIVSESNYWNRNNQRIYEWARDRNLNILGTSQDLIKRGIAEYFNKMVLTSRFKYAKYLGKTGEHFSEDIFRQQGYEKRDYFNLLKIRFPKQYQVNIQELRSLTNEHRFFLENNRKYV